MIVLGINSVYHESAAALVIDGRIIAAAEEERFTRVKHAKPAQVDNPHLLPEKAMRYCLTEAGITAADVDAVAFSFDPQLRVDCFEFDPLSLAGDWGDPAGERAFLDALDCVPDAVAAVLGCDIGDKLIWVSHHIAHAASAFYPSGFKEAAVLVVDGIAEYASTMMLKAEGQRIEVLKSLAYPHSLGFFWEKISAYLGFSEYDACKTMGLAAYGNPSALKQEFASLIQVNSVDFTIDPKLLRFRLPDFDGLAHVLGARRAPGSTIEARHADVASALQERTNAALMVLVQDLYERAPSENLCIAGGVGLNCVTNWIVKERGPYATVFIPSAPNDAGTAVGAALYVSHHEHSVPRCADPQVDPFLGPAFDADDVIAAVRRANQSARRSPDVFAEAARIIADGGLVAWFQGRMEFGPRALGNRSLLGDPRTLKTRERLNNKVKHREQFRPFAPSVLEEHAADWFEIGRTSHSLNYMLFACPVLANRGERIPAVLHEDGTSRLQIVNETQNPTFHRLISEFYHITGVPMVLNTSFNDREPIVCTPEDAIATFCNTQIDALVLGEMVIMREEQP